jgi:hypothetical protein
LYDTQSPCIASSAATSALAAAVRESTGVVPWLVNNLAGLILVLLAIASPTRAGVLWEASGGWFFGGNNEYGGLTQPPNPPALETSVGEFSNNGALCPPLDTPNYICGYFLGESDLVGPPGGGGLVTLRASARLRQRNFTSNGFARIVYGGARVTVSGLKFSTVVPPLSLVVFNFLLHGTRVETSNNGQVTVVGNGVAYLSADAQHFIQCFADVCEPIKVKVGSNGWDPGAPGGTAILLDLRTDARTSAPPGVVFDAEAAADFKDTLEVLSIEVQDANGDAIPGVSLVITDAQGQPTYTFPNTPPPPSTTTTTTLPGVTTTTLGGGTVTTTTLPGATTTTLGGGTVTTTTLPVECAPGATFGSVACRLTTLLQAVQVATDGSLESKLVGKIAAAQNAVTNAEQLVGSSRKASSKQIAKAVSALASYKSLLKTPAAKKALVKDVRAALAAPLAALRADLKALRIAKPTERFSPDRTMPATVTKPSRRSTLGEHEAQAAASSSGTVTPGGRERPASRPPTG